MIQRLRQEVATLQERMVQWRRHLHAHPELSFHEHNTAAYVAEVLKKEGIEVRENVGRLTADAKGTGVIALLRGAGSASDRCFALRADLDALPITEVGKDGYCSTNPGVMHACGHDAHTAMVLGAGLALHRLRDQWAGTVMLVFQPGEEKEPGGASLLVKEGVLSNPKPAGILGQHVTPELAVGKVGFRSGAFMAAADELYITVKGRGGHAASRDRLVDPILITARLLPALYEAAARHVPAGEPMVLSFGKVIANGATNIVPDTVAIDGTLRTFNESLRTELHELLPRVSGELARSMGGDVDFKLVKGSPVVKNDPELTARLRATAVDLLGAENVVEMDIRMGAEDFAYYTHVMPGCFYRLGTGNPAKTGTTSGLHRPEFDIDEDALVIGAGVMAWSAIRELT
ncbi:MAG TPA: M20 family metallopeptidase [Flavobacteriales bacterium]|nr:M20 family metallopeptidase [Flavobacteriales bacterium]